MKVVLAQRESDMILDLEKVLISPRVASAWSDFVADFAKDLAAQYPDLRSEEIPLEQFQLLPSGNGVIFIKVRSKKIEMAVPKCEFQLK